MNVLANPYAYSDEQEEFSSPPPPSEHPYRTFAVLSERSWDG